LSNELKEGPAPNNYWAPDYLSLLKEGPAPHNYWAADCHCWGPAPYNYWAANWRKVLYHIITFLKIHNSQSLMCHHGIGFRFRVITIKITNNWISHSTLLVLYLFVSTTKYAFFMYYSFRYGSQSSLTFTYDNTIFIPM
jgi:hypothetical protein